MLLLLKSSLLVFDIFCKVFLPLLQAGSAWEVFDLLPAHSPFSINYVSSTFHLAAACLVLSIGFTHCSSPKGVYCPHPSSNGVLLWFAGRISLSSLLQKAWYCISAAGCTGFPGTGSEGAGLYWSLCQGCQSTASGVFFSLSSQSRNSSLAAPS